MPRFLAVRSPVIPKSKTTVNGCHKATTVREVLDVIWALFPLEELSAGEPSLHGAALAWGRGHVVSIVPFYYLLTAAAFSLWCRGYFSLIPMF